MIKLHNVILIVQHNNANKIYNNTRCTRINVENKIQLIRFFLSFNVS